MDRAASPVKHWRPFLHSILQLLACSTTVAVAVVAFQRRLYSRARLRALSCNSLLGKRDLKPNLTYLPTRDMRHATLCVCRFSHRPGSLHTYKRADQTAFRLVPTRRLKFGLIPVKAFSSRLGADSLAPRESCGPQPGPKATVRWESMALGLGRPQQPQFCLQYSLHKPCNAYNQGCR